MPAPSALSFKPFLSIFGFDPATFHAAQLPGF
jgi:hypothetical protein